MKNNLTKFKLIASIMTVVVLLACIPKSHIDGATDISLSIVDTIVTTTTTTTITSDNVNIVPTIMTDGTSSDTTTTTVIKAETSTNLIAELSNMMMGAKQIPVTTITTTTTKPETTTSITTTTTIEETTIVTSEEEDDSCYEEEYDNIDKEESNATYYFYEDSMRVHCPDCIYCDPACMEPIYDEYIDYARPCKECNPDITIGTLYEEEEPEYYYEESEEYYERNWSVSEMTYYSGSWGCYGAAGTTLINNYSVACNSIPLGTTVYIKSSDGSVDGYYRVDDTGGMGGHVIDIFYSDYSYTPSSFRQAGRVSCEVWIVD